MTLVEICSTKPLISSCSRRTARCSLVGIKVSLIFIIVIIIFQVEAGQYCTFVISSDGTLHACGKVSL